MRPAFSSRTNKRPTVVLPPDADRDSETRSSAIFVSFHSFHNCRSVPRFNPPVSVIRCFDLWDDPTRLTCAANPAFVAVAYFAAAAFLIQHCHFAREKAAASRACERKMSWLPGSSMLFDCACFVTERLRSDPLKPQSGRSMASRVRRSDVCNMAEPFAAHLNADAFKCGPALPYVFVTTGAPTRFGSILLPQVGFAIMHS
jgi:hypothetical protein